MDILVVVRAENPEELARFYALLGLSFVREKHGSGLEHHAVSVVQSVFEIYPRKAHGDSTSATRLGFSVSDIDAVCDEIAASAGRVVKMPDDSPWGRRATICDPEGHRVELVEKVVP